MEADEIKKMLEGLQVQKVSVKRSRKIECEITTSSLKPIVQAIYSKGARFIIISAVDCGLDVELIYHFDLQGTIITLKVKTPKEAPEVDSITDIILGAEWAEREAADLCGVRFTGGRETPLVLKERQEKAPLSKPFRILPEVVAPVAESIASVGATAPMTSLMERRRKEAGLSEKPDMIYATPEGDKELGELMKATSFSERGGFDTERKKLRGVYK